MNKSFANVGNQLSRAKMKSVVAGRPIDPAACPYACYCEGGARALADTSGGGAICYCPDDSRIYGTSCPWV